MSYNIVKVTKFNYDKFSKMVYYREHRKDGSEDMSDCIIYELENPNLYVYAIETEDKFVGWISCVYIPKIGKWKGRGHIYVDELYVEEVYRHKGYAKALMAKADELCVRLKAHGIRLYVNVNNPEALRLYETCGYQKDGQAHFMEKGYESIKY